MSGHQQGGKNWETGTDIYALLGINQRMRTYHLAQCFWTVLLEETLESPSDCKIKPVNPKGNQSWIFIGRTDAEANTPILWPPDGKSWLTGKDPDAGKHGRQEEMGMTDDEMVGWHHWLYGHEFEQAPGVVKDREAWRAAVHGVAKSRTGLSGWTITAIWTVCVYSSQYYSHLYQKEPGQQRPLVLKVWSVNSGVGINQDLVGNAEHCIKHIV